MGVRGAALVLLLVVGVAGCSNGRRDREVAIPGASIASDGALVVESVCLPDDRLDAAVVEDTRKVTVTVTALDYDPENSDGCLGGKEVPLSSPLGDRTLIDGTTGEQVEVQRG